MIYLSFLTNFCSSYLFWWILPFLLGLLAGWLLWGHYKKYRDQVIIKDDEINRLKADLKKCKDSTVKTSSTTYASSVSESTSSTFEPLMNPVDTAPEKPVLTKGHIFQDNLQIIEGIGPKMEEILKLNGVDTFSKLSNSSVNEIRSILDTYGDKYRIIDPTDWSSQARFAKDERWDELIDFQHRLGTSDDRDTDSKLEKLFIKMGLKKRFEKDDLKAVEGIGPKIESLLKESGITTWRALANTPTERLRAILDSAGPKFKIADPGTWAKQAEMADNGEWSKLDEYQEFLIGGKEPS